MTKSLLQVITGLLVLPPLAGALDGTVRVADLNLIPYEIVNGTTIPAPLTNIPCDPDKGRLLASLQSAGNCLSCHRMPIPEEPDHGGVGTDLAGVSNRWSEGELRLRLVNPKIVNPQTVMPAFYRVNGLYRVAKPFYGSPILTAQQIENVICYLKTLK